MITQHALVTILILIVIAAIVSLLLPQQANTNARAGISALFVAFIIALYQSFVADNNLLININILDVHQHLIIFSLWYDSIARIMVPFVLFIATLIYLYAQRYLLSEVTRPRFLTQLCLVTFSVVLLIMSANLFTAFIAWQFIGLSLYLLLNHYHYDLHANRAAKKKFAINRIGDLCFLIAVVITLESPTAIFFSNLSVMPHPAMVATLIFIAVMTKSAQFPFHIWLADTMETPTPVSALMHAGVINSGGILLAKLAATVLLFPLLMTFMCIIGLITVISGAIMMSLQADVKKKLAYSTMGQMGYMVMQCGVGSFSTAIFHLISHGFFKVCLFLHAGQTIKLKVQHYSKLSIKSLSFTIILSVISLLITLEYSRAFSLVQPILIWGFILISMLQINKLISISPVSFVAKLIVFAASLLAYGCYVIVLSHFIHFFSGLDEWVSPLWQSLLAGLFVAAQLLTWTDNKVNIAAWRRVVKQYSIETCYRHYLLNPLRWLGDISNRALYQHKRTAKTPIVLMVVMILLYAAAYFDANPSVQTIILWIFLALLLIAAIIANRAKILLRIWTWLLILELSFIGIGIAARSAFLHKIIIFHIINLLLVMLMMAILMAGKKKENKRAQVYLKFNRLPWFMFYLSSGLLLFIGIPGSASFVAELFFLNHLLQTNLAVTVIYATGMLLLSIVILHTLQTYVFDNERLIYSKKNLSPLVHSFCVFTIGINIFNGINPHYLLQLL